MVSLVVLLTFSVLNREYPFCSMQLILFISVGAWYHTYWNKLDFMVMLPFFWKYTSWAYLFCLRQIVVSRLNLISRL